MDTRRQISSLIYTHWLHLSLELKRKEVWGRAEQDGCFIDAAEMGLHMAFQNTLFLPVQTSGCDEVKRGQINLNDVSN